LVQKSASFVIDREGMIRYARSSFNPRGSLDLPEVLMELEALPAPSP
jgi:peroxiredoxin